MALLRFPLAAFTSLALLLAAAGFWPTAHEQARQVPAPVAEDGLLMTLDLDAPREIHQGTTELLHLTTHLAALASATPNLPPGTQTVVGVESACVQPDPPGETLQAAILGQTQAWSWQLSPMPASAAPCELDVVVRLRNPQGERIVWVKQMQVATPAVMGLPQPAAQGLGVSAGVLGLLGLALVQLKLQRGRKTA